MLICINKIFQSIELLLQANVMYERMQEKILADEITRLFKENDFIELSERWLLINHRETAQRILRSYGDDVKRDILSTVSEIPLTASEIIKVTGFPMSTVYREIDDLMRDGLLMRAGYDKAARKTAIKLIALIQHIKVEIDGNHIFVLIKTNISHNNVFRI